MRTADITVAQETQSHRASEATERASSPTARVHSRPAFAESTRRSGNSAERSVQVCCGQSGSGHEKRRLDQTSRTRRLNAAGLSRPPAAGPLSSRSPHRRTPGCSADRLDADEQLRAVVGHSQHPEAGQSQQRVAPSPMAGGLPLSKLSTATRMARPLAAPVDTYRSAVRCSRAPVHREEPDMAAAEFGFGADVMDDELAPLGAVELGPIDVSWASSLLPCRSGSRSPSLRADAARQLHSGLKGLHSFA